MNKILKTLFSLAIMVPASVFATEQALENYALNSPSSNQAGPSVVSSSQTTFKDQLNYASAYGVSAQVGTLGIGINLTRALISDYLNIRLQGNYLEYCNCSIAEQNSYKVNANTYGLLLDYQPMGGVFRFSGGMYYDNRSVSATSTIVNLGGGYSGNGSAGANFKPLAPYLGIGVGSQAASSLDKKGMIISFDAGVLFQDPEAFANVNCIGSNCSQANFNKQVNQFKNDLQNTLNTYGKYYPVLSFGLGYRF